MKTTERQISILIYWLDISTSSSGLLMFPCILYHSLLSKIFVLHLVIIILLRPFSTSSNHLPLRLLYPASHYNSLRTWLCGSALRTCFSHFTLVIFMHAIMASIPLCPSFGMCSVFQMVCISLYNSPTEVSPLCYIISIFIIIICGTSTLT